LCKHAWRVPLAIIYTFYIQYEYFLWSTQDPKPDNDIYFCIHAYKKYILYEVLAKYRCFCVGMYWVSTRARAQYWRKKCIYTWFPKKVIKESLCFLLFSHDYYCFRATVSFIVLNESFYIWEVIRSELFWIMKRVL
jgi:hypothetical protein